MSDILGGKCRRQLSRAFPFIGNGGRAVPVFFFFMFMAFTSAGEGHWLSTTHDFGAILEDDGAVSFTFRYVNEGTDSIEVGYVRAGCGCTRVSHTDGAIAPGDTLAVTAVYDPVRRYGEFDVEIEAGCDPYPWRTTLSITGSVVMSDRVARFRFPVEIGGGVRLAADTLALQSDSDCGGLSGRLEGYNASTGSVVLVASGSGAIEVEAVPAEVPPGEFFIIQATVPEGVAADGLTVGLSVDGRIDRKPFQVAVRE